MRTVRPLLVLAAVLAAAGCAGHPAGHPADHPAPSGAGTPTPSRAAVAWFDRVCAADDDLQTQQASTGTAALSLVPRDPNRSQVVHFVAVVRRDLQGTLKDLRAIRSGAVPGGDRVVAAYVDAVQGALSKVRRDERDARASGTDPFVLPYIPQRVARFVQDAVPHGADLPTLVAADRTLRQAYHRARRCRGSHPLTASATPTP